jgi:hypothetical protein
VRQIFSFATLLIEISENKTDWKLPLISQFDVIIQIITRPSTSLRKSACVIAAPCEPAKEMTAQPTTSPRWRGEVGSRA